MIQQINNIEFYIDKPIGIINIKVTERLNKDRVMIQCQTEKWQGIGFIHNSIPAILLYPPRPKYLGKTIDGFNIDLDQWNQIQEYQTEIIVQYKASIPDEVVWRMQDGNLIMDYSGKVSGIEPDIIMRLGAAIQAQKSLAKALSIPVPSVVFQKYKLTRNSYMDLITKYELTADSRSKIINSNIIAFTICFRCGKAKIVGKKDGRKIIRMPDLEYESVYNDLRESRRLANISGASWKDYFEEKGYSIYIRDRKHCGC